MGFWIAVILTLFAAIAVLALGGRRRRTLAGREADMAMYRDQLREVERDRTRGTITAEEAERLRLEVSRRLLAADKAAQGESGPAQGSLSLALGLAGVLLAGSVLVYAWLGAPGYADFPRADRIAAAARAKAERPTQAAMEAALPAWAAPTGADARWIELVQRLREALKDHPDDPKGLELLAQNEAQLGNYAAAWRAQARLNAVRNPAPADLLLQAVLMVEATNGRVSPEAEQVLDRVLAAEPANGGATYLLGLLDAQTGRPDSAFQRWAPLLARSTAGDWWEAPLRQDLPTLAALAGHNRYELPPRVAAPATGEAGGMPSQAEMDAAANLTESDRADMIRSMVDGLAARLEAEGGAASEWAQLIRSLGVLGERERAEATLTKARGAFAADPAGLVEIEAAATAAGLGP